MSPPFSPASYSARQDIPTQHRRDEVKAEGGSTISTGCIRLLRLSIPPCLANGALATRIIGYLIDHRSVSRARFSRRRFLVSQNVHVGCHSISLMTGPIDSIFTIPVAQTCALQYVRSTRARCSHLEEKFVLCNVLISKRNCTVCVFIDRQLDT